MAAAASTLRLVSRITVQSGDIDWAAVYRPLFKAAQKATGTHSWKSPIRCIVISGQKASMMADAIGYFHGNASIEGANHLSPSADGWLMTSNGYDEQKCKTLGREKP